MWTSRLDRLDHGLGQASGAMVLGELLDVLPTGPHYALLAWQQVVQQPRVIDRGKDGPVSGRRPDTDLPIGQRLRQAGMVSTVDGEGVVAAGVDIPQIPAVRPTGPVDLCGDPEPAAVRDAGPQHRTGHD